MQADPVATVINASHWLRLEKCCLSTWNWAFRNSLSTRHLFCPHLPHFLSFWITFYRSGKWAALLTLQENASFSLFLVYLVDGLDFTWSINKLGDLNGAAWRDLLTPYALRRKLHFRVKCLSPNSKLYLCTSVSKQLCVCVCH